MSNKKEEMITIKLIPSDVREFARFDGQSDSINRRIADACQAALDARKSKYERWREEIGDLTTWPDSPQDIVSVGKKGYVPFNHNTEWERLAQKLLAAAPQLLDALIKLLRAYEKHVCQLNKNNCAKEAIKLALPDDVADEVLGK